MGNFDNLEIIEEFTSDDRVYGVYVVNFKNKRKIFVRNNNSIGVVSYYKNIFAVTVTIFLARRTKGVILLAFIILNGLILGSLLTSLAFMGTSVLFLFLGIMTHGIFELTAIFIAIALGFKLLLSSEDNYKENMKIAKNVFIKILISLLIIAGFAESYLTPYVLTLI